jgi:antitoxin component YwqK of YwqJK toxin-antitoxin module
MVSHTYSKEANVRAKEKYYENHTEKIKLISKCRYKFDKDYRENKKIQMRQRMYEANSILFIKYLFK